MQDGEIVERGNHDDLLLANGIYSSMWYQQQSSLHLEDDGQKVGGANKREHSTKL